MTVCLVMIVKDEAAVIERCLASVLPVVDRVCIVDTGSTDATPEIVADCVDVAKGGFHTRPWVDFGHNRTQALRLAKLEGCDYLLMMDADHVWRGELPADLAADAYYVEHRYSGTHYGLACLLRSSIPWRYEGVIHEFVTADVSHTIVPLAGPWVEVHHDGARARDPETYAKDAKVLEAALAKEPGNARYAFYLAQSLKDAGKLASALVAYKHRTMMAGWDEETWYARLEYARLCERTSASPETVQRAYLAAWNARPTRAEPLVDLARWHRLNGESALAYLFALKATQIPRPPDKLFVDEAVYTWRAWDELAIAGFYADRQMVGKLAAGVLLADAKFPPDQRARIEANAKCYQ